MIYFCVVWVGGVGLTPPPPPPTTPHPKPQIPNPQSPFFISTFILFFNINKYYDIN